MIFRGDITVRGKHSKYLQALSQMRSEKDEESIKIFDTYLTAYFSAAVFGAKNKKKAVVDMQKASAEQTKGLLSKLVHKASREEKIPDSTIYENALTTSQEFCDKCYRIVMLLDDRNISNKQRQDNAFITGFDGKETFGLDENKQIFHDYARGGLEYMFEKLVKRPDYKLDDLYANFSNFLNELATNTN